MDFDEYRKRGKEMVDYIADYLQDIRNRGVSPNIQPGYMRDLVADSAPEDGEDWETIFRDVERVIMPGVTHWQSPYMHAHLPALNSFPSLLGDMLSNAISGVGFTWASNPSCTELETIVMDWLAKMIGLPEQFLHKSSDKTSSGGGVIQTTADEATLVALLTARMDAIRRARQVVSDLDEAGLHGALVGYCSDQAQSAVEKAGLIGLVKIQLLNTDSQLSLRGEEFRKIVEQDIADGLIPFFLCATLGTTGSCAFDNLEELGLICQEHEIWMHVDAAYAGSAFICPEYRSYLQGVAYAKSIVISPSKWLMVHFDCAAMWFADSHNVHQTFCVDPIYLRYEKSGDAIDYMHWQIPLSRRFRALKLWFVLRSFGLTGLQNHIRKSVSLAKQFEDLVRANTNFELPFERNLAMVVFRLKGPNERSEMLLEQLNLSGLMHLTSAKLHGFYVIRFPITSSYTTSEDVLRDFGVICKISEMIPAEVKRKNSKITEYIPKIHFRKISSDMEEEKDLVKVQPLTKEPAVAKGHELQVNPMKTVVDSLKKVPESSQKVLESSQKVFEVSQKVLESSQKVFEGSQNVSRECTVSRRRWVILTVFSLYSMTNQFQWIAYSTISDKVANFYGVQSTAVDWLSMIYHLVYIPLIFPATWLLDTKGLRITAYIGSFTNFLGAIIKCFSPYSRRFGVTFLGQTVCGVSQVFILGLPARIAAVWFAEREVPFATAIGVFGTMVGVALGFLVPLIVPPPSVMTNETVAVCINSTFENIYDNGLGQLFYISAGVTGMLFVIVLLVFREKPLYPPNSAQVAIIEKDGSTSYTEWILLLFKDLNFIALVITYGIITGCFYAISTLLNQLILSHFEGQSENAGYIGIMLVVSGLVASVVFGIVLAWSGKFKEITFVSYLSSFFAMVIFMIVFTYSGKIWAIFFVAGILGFFMTGYLPVGCELAAEITYPAPEGTSSGLLNCSAQIFGLILTTAMGELLTRYGSLVANGLLVASLFVGTAMTYFIKSDLKRTAIFQAGREQSASLSTSISALTIVTSTSSLSPMKY